MDRDQYTLRCDVGLLMFLASILALVFSVVRLEWICAIATMAQCICFIGIAGQAIDNRSR